MTENRLEDWSLLMAKSTDVIGGECKYCTAVSDPYELKKVFIALPWLTPKEAKQVLTQLKKNLRPALKVYSIQGVTEGLRGALNGLPYYPVEDSPGVITLHYFRARVEDQIRSMVLDAEGTSRKLGVLYDGDLYPRIVTVEKSFKWGFIAKTENGFKSFRWEKLQAGPWDWYPNHGRGKYRFGVHVMATVAKPHDRCENHGFGLM
jgi:hypothetical protein